MIEKFTTTTTTHSVPRSISPKDGNRIYCTWSDLLESEMSSGGIAGMYCSVLSLIKDDSSVHDSDEGSKYTFGDKWMVELSHSLCYTVARLYPQMHNKEEFSNFINHNLIPSGYNIVTESTYEDICDIMLSVLE